MTTATRFEVGHSLQTHDEIDSLPVGTVIGPDEEHRFEKRAEGWWNLRGQRAMHLESFSTEGYNRVLSLPATHPEWMQVGHGLQTHDEIEALPIGAVIGPSVYPHERYELRPEGWWSVDGDHLLTSSVRNSFSTNGYNQIISLPVEGQDPMTINTLEELEAIPVGGSAYLISGSVTQRWNRTDTGWRIGDAGASVPTSVLEGAAIAGHVSRRAEKQVGQWWTRSHRTYYILSITGEGAYPVKVANFFDGRYQSLDIYGTEVNLGTLVEAPEWGASAQSLLVALQTTQTQLDDVRSRLEAERTELRTTHEVVRNLRAAPDTSLISYKTRLQEALHEYIDNYLSGVATDNLIELMEAHDMEGPPPAQETVQVYISVEGETEVEISDELAYSLVGSSDIYHGNDEEVTISWTRSYTVDREVSEDSCACEEVDRDDISTLLSGDGITYTSYDYEVTCDND